MRNIAAKHNPLADVENSGRISAFLEVGLQGAIVLPSCTFVPFVVVVLRVELVQASDEARRAQGT
jgi:hypothetical protein